MFFVYRRATTRELFALHEEQGRNALVPGDTMDNDYKLASTTPGFGGLRDGTNGAGVSDAGIRWWDGVLQRAYVTVAVRDLTAGLPAFLPGLPVCLG